MEVTVDHINFKFWFPFAIIVDVATLAGIALLVYQLVLR